jgi:acetyl-CoA C-acetyltransferase
MPEPAMTTPVFILGGYQTDFAKCWSRGGEDLSHMARETILATLEDAALDADDLQSIHVGNAFAELQRGQAHLGALPASVIPQLIGVPAMRHEAACASGSIAVLAAMAEIEAGRYDCVLVLGIEEERNSGGDQAAANMNAAAWVSHEPMPARFMWPWAFGQLALEYERRHGLDSGVLHRIAEINFANARRNPRAQTREWQFQAQSFSDDDALNPPVAPGLRRQQCAQISDGACALVLASADYARRHATLRGLSLDALPRILGWGHATADLPFTAKLERARGNPGLLFPHVSQAVQDALRRAGSGRISDLDGLELHDCFAITELVLIEHAGLAPAGAGAALVQSGAIERGGPCPVNPSGGLIGGGHPVGATGVRMLLDAARQVRGEAGACQVEGARRFGTLNIGGAFATVCSFVVGAGA